MSQFEIDRSRQPIALVFGLLYASACELYGEASESINRKRGPYKSDGAQVQNEIVQAVCQILSQLHRLTDLGLPPQRIDRIRRETIFFLYDGGISAKWSVERAHSARARQLHRDALASGRRFNGTNYPITYDHALPLATLREGMRKAAASPLEMREFLDRNIRGVIIHKEEDALLSKLKLRYRLPNDAMANDPLARYRVAGIPFEPDNIARLTR